jgi:hypothetical protein
MIANLPDMGQLPFMALAFFGRQVVWSAHES